MRTAIIRLLLSAISRNPSIAPRYLTLDRSLTYFSTESKRSSRGERGPSDRSDELFIRDLNHGDQSLPEKSFNATFHPSSPIPGRPLRGERKSVGFKEDLFPDFSQKQSRTIRDRSNRSPSSPFQHKLNLDSETRGESFDFFLPKSPLTSPDNEKSADRVGESLFQKLKLDKLSATPEEESDKTKIEPESSPEDADQIFKKMKETGLIPNAVSMLDGLCKDGLVQDAMKLFGLMREKGTIPEVVIYTAVVEGFCKASKFDDAKRIFKKMQKNAIVPNAFSFSVLIQGLCRGKRLEDACEFSLEMVEAGHALNGATFAGIVDLFCKEKGVKEAEELVGNLRRKGFALDENAVREHLDKKGPYSPMVWEAIFGKKKSSQRPF